jgi:hypothetical protein
MWHVWGEQKKDRVLCGYMRERLLSRNMRIWEDFQETKRKNVDWIYLAQYTEKWRLL